MATLCVAMITLTVPIFILSIVSFTLTRVCCCPKYPPGRYPSCLSHPSHSRNRIANSCLFHIHHATRSGALPTRFPAQCMIWCLSRQTSICCHGGPQSGTVGRKKGEERNGRVGHSERERREKHDMRGQCHLIFHVRTT